MDRISDRWLLALVIGLLSLLPLLAYLQYQWLGRLSEGEAARMHENLTVAAKQFSHEVTRVADELEQAFRIDFAGGDKESLARHLEEALSSWRRSASHPGLLETIYYVNVDDEGAAQLFRYRESTSTLQAMDWPETLAPWQAYLGGTAHFLHAGRAVTAPRSDDGARRVAAAPGLVVPIAPASFPRLPGVQPPLDLEKGVLLLTLDSDYLGEAFFSDLVEAHFKLGRSSEYDVLIASVSDRNDVAYVSRRGLRPEDLERPDISTTFGLSARPRQYTIFNASDIREQVDRALGSVVIHFDTLGITSPDVRGMSLEAARALEALPSAPHAPPPGLEPGSRAWSSNTALLAGPPEQTWELSIKHRAGSLEAAVSAMRWRNLSITSAILLLLGIAVCLLYLSLRRARGLAERQMEFVAGVSHELRTPLAVIGSAGENLADGVVEGEGQRRRYGELITRESRRLTTMVEQMLALAGAESDVRIFPRPVVVRDYVERVLAEFEPEIEREGFKVTTHIPSDLPRIEVDPGSLSTVLRNLLSNALKYSDGKRTISISGYVEQAGDGEAVCIAVHDEGMGIAARELTRIFEPFYRGERAREEQIRGSGIGLNLSRKLVEAHGGRLTVESAPGQGSTFTIYLPAYHEGEPTPTADTQPV